MFGERNIADTRRMQRARVSVAVVLLPLILLVSCKQRGGSGSILEFPSADELAAIAAKPVSAPPFRPSGRAVGEWQLIGPLPDKIDSRAVEGDSPSDQLARTIAGQIAELEPRAAMQCVAREVGHFMLMQGRQPTLPLQQFMLDRCGATLQTFGWAALTWNEGDAGSGLDDLLALARSNGLNGDFGVWLGREGDHHMAILVAGRESATIDPLAMSIVDDRVAVEGSIGAHEWVVGYVTRGPRGVQTCRTQPAEPNRFHVICPVDRRDPGAAIEVVAAAPGRALGEVRARVWVSPDGSLPTRYAVAPDSGPAFTERSAASLVELFNTLRSEAGVAPLSLVDAQSDEFERLHDHYRHARHVGDAVDRDRIALGLLAGRSLGRPVVDGMFGELVLDGTRSRKELLEATLLHPMTRATLLDPERTLLALSVSEAGADAMAEAMLATWAPAELGHRPQDEEWMFDLIDLTREVRGLPDMKRVGGPVHDALVKWSADVREGRLAPKVALDGALQDIAEQAEIPIRGLLLFAQDVEELEAPTELLGRDGLQMAVHVELIQAPGSAWAQLVVMVAYVYDADVRG